MNLDHRNRVLNLFCCVQWILPKSGYGQSKDLELPDACLNYRLVGFTACSLICRLHLRMYVMVHGDERAVHENWPL